VSESEPSTTGPRRALITGVAGQDGTYLARHLVRAGYEVHGIDRRAGGHGRVEPASFADRFEGARKVTLHRMDLLDRDAVRRLVRACRPHEIYNLAAIAFVPDSFDSPGLVREINAEAVAHLLEIVREEIPTARFFQASSCEMFGDAEPPQDERTSLRPMSPYGEAKADAHRAVARYREEWGLHCSCGISFNHESPRRERKYVTRKVTDGVARIKLGLTETLRLGNLDAKRDWGYAPEYVEAMWRMLQQPEPGDYVLATGVSRTVGEMAELAFECVGLELGDHLVTDPGLRRVTDPSNLVGNPAKAWEKLGWKARTGLPSLIELMVKSDLARLAARDLRREPARSGG
jgi:GDPmannose 4,6-dehydratase